MNRTRNSVVLTAALAMGTHIETLGPVTNVIHSSGLYSLDFIGFNELSSGIMDKAVLKGMLAAAAAVVSAALAVAGLALRLQWQIPTPGTVIAGLAARSPSVSLGGMLFIHLAANFVFWFTSICLLYWILTKLVRKLRGSGNRAD
jgi:hypothetical protein